ncbi:MAG: hypothetical protein WA230_23915, partial [Xanthobacteraceae bacterium]
SKVAIVFPPGAATAAGICATALPAQNTAATITSVGKQIRLAIENSFLRVTGPPRGATVKLAG